MLTYLGVALAGAIGAPVRYLVDLGVTAAGGRTFPLGTLVVNVSGSFLLGLVAGLALYHGFADAPKAVLGAGFCGAYTTFSAFAVETVLLTDEGAPRAAITNTVVSLVAGPVAAALGMAVAAAF